jgi:trans-2,3-dihydro-3-hydroxyanthranilate isomerase
MTASSAKGYVLAASEPHHPTVRRWIDQTSMAHPANALDYRHVDVFAERPFAGNGLVVVFGGIALSADQLLSVTGEMRQFESIFLDIDADRVVITARIFTAEEELPFAGHPVIGAAAAVHERVAGVGAERSWVFRIAGREVEVTSRRTANYYAAEMNQGRAAFSAPVTGSTATSFLGALNLDRSDLRPLPMQVVSTGLAYLIVPVASDGLANARIVADDFEARLATIGAKFAYIFDPESREGRTWDNSGAVEDIATGSAAGPAVAYLLEHRLAEPNEEILLHQGRFVDRASTMSVTVRANGQLWVGGPVAPVASGRLDAIRGEGRQRERPWRI